jgi:hypothetical protein
MQDDGKVTISGESFLDSGIGFGDRAWRRIRGFTWTPNKAQIFGRAGVNEGGIWFLCYSVLL